MANNKTINVKGTEVTIIKKGAIEYISLTDMLKAKDGNFFISDWLRNRNTVEFLSIWETVYNPDFNYGQSAIIKSKGVAQSERLTQLNTIAISQMKSLLGNTNLKNIGE